MKPPMNQTAYKVTHTRNAYGDYIATGSTMLKCHFRYITELQNQAQEQLQGDAMAWFEPDADINEADIVMIDGSHWKVDRVTKARKLRDTAVQFIKCDLLAYGAIS